MSGPQVIEIVVIDSDINDTDEAKGEPDVTVNGKNLRMVQAVDGNWYGYFADRLQANTADDTTTVGGEGLDFGSVCLASEGSTAIGIDLDGADGVAFDTDNSCGTVPSITDADPNFINVLRDAKDINTAVPTGSGTNPPDVNPVTWPFIQLYTLNPTGNVIIQYNKGGGAQSTTLTFDTVDHLASASFDRISYPQGA
jgi:hypothetical protein